MATGENFLFSDPACTVPAKGGIIGNLEILEAGLRNIVNWSKYNYNLVQFELDGNKNEECIYINNSIHSTQAAVSGGHWFNINRIYAGAELFSGKYILNDDKSNSDTTKVPNAFFISKRGEIPTGKDAASIFLRIAGSSYNSEEGASISVGVWLGRYAQSPDYDGRDRSSWFYYIGTYDAYPEVDIAQYNNSQYTNIGLFRVTMPWGADGADAKFIAVVGNYDDSGHFPAADASATKGKIMLFPEILWTDSQREPDPYAPEPEGNTDTGFDIADLPRTATGYSSLTDRSPYGLNTSDTGHVYLSSANYSKLIASIFGRNFTGDYGGTQSITDADIQGQSYTEFQKIVEYTKSAMNNTVLDIAADMAVNSLAESLGITEKIRNAMIDGILNAHIFPAVFSGTSAPISTLSGYDLKTTVSANAISPEIAEASFSATIPRPSTSFLGYEPYTKITIFAPFIGSIDIPASVLFNGGITGAIVKQNTRPDSGSVGLYYQIDSYTGLCSCQVYLNGNFYTERQGMCAASIPIVGAAKTGAAAKGIISAVSSIMSGGVGGVFGAVGSLTEGLTAPSTAPIIGGSSANIAALLSKRTPVWHMTYKVPAMPNPSNYAPILGGMTNQKGTVGSYSGFCQFYDADLSAVSAPQAVKEQIIQQLKQGVYL